MDLISGWVRPARMEIYLRWYDRLDWKSGTYTATEDPITRTVLFLHKRTGIAPPGELTMAALIEEEHNDLAYRMIRSHITTDVTKFLTETGS